MGKRLISLFVVLAAGPGCKGSRSDAGSVAEGASAPPTAPAPAADEAACAGAHADDGPIAWFHDDYAAARTCARERELPLVIDMWAPWCHTCLSMKYTVLRDPGLAPLADRFVWLALDTDKEINAPAVARFEPDVWPTFFVVSPEDQAIQARYRGAASVEQLREFLRQGEAGHLDGRTAEGGLAADSPLRRVREGDRAAVAGDLEAADAAYSAALAAAEPSWARRPDVLVSLIAVKVDRQDFAGCAALARADLDRTGRSASASDFAYYASRCAAELEPDARRALLEQVAARLARLVDDADAPLSVDDRGDAMRILRGIHEDLGNSAEAKKLAVRQRDLLDAAAERAPTPFAAMTYNWPRAEVYAYLGEPERLIPALERSAADLPTQYDPPYRLAWIHLQAGKPEAALPLAERAVALAYGPRKARVQSLLVDIHGALGDRAAQIEAQKALVQIYQSLPEGHRNEGGLARAREALAELTADAPSQSD